MVEFVCDRVELVDLLERIAIRLTFRARGVCVCGFFFFLNSIVPADLKLLPSTNNENAQKLQYARITGSISSSRFLILQRARAHCLTLAQYHHSSARRDKSIRRT